MNEQRQREHKANWITRIFKGLVIAVAVMIPHLTFAAVPAVDNADGASSIMWYSASLNGTLASDGAQVYVFWGSADGDTNFEGWENTGDLGVKLVGPLSLVVTNLMPNQTYYYRYYATNVDGEVWASTTTNFQTQATLAAQLPVNLGSTARFTILAGASVTCPAGAGYIHGDIGAYPIAGSSILIPSDQVIGTVYARDASYALGAAVIDPVLLLAAKGDLTIAYQDARDRTPIPVGPYLNPGAGNIGGLNLVPGLYKFTGEAHLSGADVTLTGGPDDIWIFQIATALIVEAGVNRSVILAGGARAKNIFWQVGTSATIGTGASFKGTIIADQAITMDGGSTLDGRALAFEAGVTFGGLGGSLPRENEGPLTIVITSPTDQETYVGTTNSQSMGGWAADSDGAGVTLVTLRNDRDVAGYNAVGTALWDMTNGLPVYQGENNISAVAYDGSMNSATDTLRVAYSGDLQYDDVLRSGNIVQFINIPDNLTAGATVNLQWSVLSYMPIVSRIYAGVPGGWSFFKNGVYQGVTNSPWNLNGRHAKVYSFDCDWIVPENSGEFKIWFNVAQMDSDQFMIPIIPDGIDARPDPVYAKLIQRTILAGGTEVDTLSGLDNWDSDWIFETIDEQKRRSGVSITSITMPDNLTQGSQVTCQWRVQSYVDVDAQMLLLNFESSNVWLTVNAARIGVPTDTTYNFQDRSSGTTTYAKEYTFQATFTVPAQPGVQQLYFRSRNSGAGTNSLWMAQNLSASVDSRPVLENDRFGRMINRTINP